MHRDVPVGRISGTSLFSLRLNIFPVPGRELEPYTEFLEATLKKVSPGNSMKKKVRVFYFYHTNDVF
jgi:hypothetical protein